MIRPLALVLTLASLAGAASAQPRAPVCFDFETRDLQGWTVVRGRFGELPSANDNDRWGGDFSKQGKCFIGTYEGCGDEAVGEIHSPTFTIHYRTMALLVGGGGHARTYVALCRASDGKELFVERGNNAERMTQRIWDVSPFVGQAMFIKVVDDETGAWGHINVDYVREIAPEEEAEMAAKAKAAKQESEARLRQWLAELEQPSKRKVYRGDALKDIAFPLGGIGTGTVSLCGDGALREWQVFNQVAAASLVPGGFFAIRVKPSGGDSVAALLQTSPLAPQGSPPAVSAIEFIGEYPIAYVRYLGLPVKLTLEAFSPMIPMNEKDSALPAAVFNFSVTNPSSERATVSLLASLQNAVGYDGHSPIEGVAGAGYGGNVNEMEAGRGWATIRMRSSRLAPDAKQFGTMALTALGSGVIAAPQWDDLAAPWSDFAADGRLTAAGGAGPSAEGKTWNGALAASVTLAPGEEKQVTFLLTWHFPNRMNDYANLEPRRLGNRYNVWFKDAAAVAEYVRRELPRLTQETRLFHDTFYQSTLPYWLLDCVSSQISTVRCPTCFWTEDDVFAGFEGCGAQVGCCPMNCTHVWNYEQTLAHLWPALERNMRATDLGPQLNPDGGVRHRTVLPLSLLRDTGPFADGQMGTVLKAYREHLHSESDDWLRANWPQVRAAMDFTIATWDDDHDGVPDGEQWNTYDCAVYGHNAFVGGLYLAALRAAERMALLMGEPGKAADYKALYERGAANMDQELWNGEYFVQKYDAQAHTETQYGMGCLSDQMLGQWWAHLLDLGHVLPEPHVRKALGSIWRYNWLSDFSEFQHSQRVFASGRDRGLLCCTWPKGGRPLNPILYCDEVWTGIEYQVAAHMMFEGMTPEALRIVRAARDRYDGVPRPPFKRNPWNEIECGDHYARPMSSWSLLLAAQGFAYDGPRGRLRFSPNLMPENHRSLFSTAAGWGSLAQQRRGHSQTNRLELCWGRLRATQLELTLPQEAAHAKTTVQVRVRGQLAKPQITVKGRALTLTFAESVELQAGDALTVRAAW